MRRRTEDREELVAAPAEAARGTTHEFWVFFGAGAFFSVLSVILVLFTRRSFAAKRGSLAGCGMNALLVVLFIASSVWARTDILIPTVQLFVMIIAGTAAPVFLSTGAAGYLTLTGRHSSLDFVIGAASSIVSFGVFVGAAVVLLLRGLTTAM
jgi:hypothetical protein